MKVYSLFTTPQKAKKLGYTHHGEMYGFAGYYYDGEDETHTTFIAKNIITDLIVEFMIYIESIFGINEGFPIKIKEKL